MNSKSPNQNRIRRRILYIEVSPSIGGSSIDLANISKLHASSDYELACVYIFRGNHVDTISKIIKKRFFLSMYPGGFFSIIATLVVQSIQLLNITIKFKPDILHFNNSVFYPGVFVGSLLNIPIICHLRSLPYNHKKKQQGVTKSALLLSKKITQFIAVSNAVKNAYITAGYDADSIEVINSGIDIEQIRNMAFRSNKPARTNTNEKFIIGTVTRLSSEKGVDILIDAIALVVEKHNNVICNIIGDGPLDTDLVRKANQLNLQNIVNFLGVQKNPFSVSQHFDVFVLSSRREGWPLVTMESMILGVPVIATKVGGIQEQISSGSEGIIVPPNDPRLLAKTILHLIDNPSQLKSLGANAKKRAENQFSLKNVKDKIEKIYDNILSPESNFS